MNGVTVGWGLSARGPSLRICFFEFQIFEQRASTTVKNWWLTCEPETFHGNHFVFPCWMQTRPFHKSCVQIIPSMSSNSKQKAECKTAAGPTCKREGSGEAWKQFWATAQSKTKKRRKKPLTREESKRRKQVKQAKKNRKKVVEVLNDKKPYSRLLRDSSLREMLTASDWFDLLNGEKPTEWVTGAREQSSLYLHDSRETFNVGRS